MEQISSFGNIIIFGFIGVAFIFGGYITSLFLRKDRPNPIKNSTYECGEIPVNDSWSSFNPRFYTLAILFLLFEVELLFLFPWATVFSSPEITASFSQWGIIGLVEMFIFLSILIVGLIYAWKNGDLSWVKPIERFAFNNSSSIESKYLLFNNKKHALTTFEIRKEEEIKPTVVSKAPSGIKRPMPKAIIPKISKNEPPKRR
jgi:NADH-quinone oxidoreductase subunit A